MNDVKNISYSGVAYKLADSYKDVSQSTNRLETKRDFLGLIYDGLTNNPLATDDEKWITTMAKIVSLKDAYEHEHVLNNTDAVKVGEIFLNEFFTPDAKVEPLEKRIAKGVSTAVKSLKNPDTQVKVLTNCIKAVRYTYGMNETEDKISDSSRQLSKTFDILDCFLKTDDKVKVGLEVLKSIGTPGPIPEVLAKFYSDATKAVTSADGKQRLRTNRIDTYKSLNIPLDKEDAVEAERIKQETNIDKLKKLDKEDAVEAERQAELASKQRFGTVMSDKEWEKRRTAEIKREMEQKDAFWKPPLGDRSYYS